MAKQEVRRGRKFVEYHDPDTQDAFTFTQEIGAHDVSYQETVGGSWLPVNESWETDGQDGFSFRAHRMNHKVRFDSIGAWRWYPRRNVETEYIVINRPQCWLTATKRWGNLLVNGISREGRDITLTSVRKVTRVIHSRWNGIKTDWILLNSTAPTKFRQQIDLVGLTELDGWLYGADGEKVALLTPTTAIGADGAELPCSGSYVDGYLQFEADVTGAVYPVVIDPDFSVQPDPTAGQDTYMYLGNKTSTAGSNNTTISVGRGAVQQYCYRGLIKFDLSAIPSSAVVSSAVLSLYYYSGTDEVSSTINFYRQLKDWTESSACWTNYKAATAWTTEGGFDSNDCEQTGIGSVTISDVTYGWKNISLTASKVQEWIAGTLTNNGLLAIGNEATNNSRKYFYSSDYTDDTSLRPILAVTYTAAGGFHPINMTAQMQSLTGGMRS